MFLCEGFKKVMGVRGSGAGARAVTFEGEQSPFQRAECRRLVPGADLLEEAICVMAPERTRKAVDPRCQLPTTTHEEAVSWVWINNGI